MSIIGDCTIDTSLGRFGHQTFQVDGTVGSVVEMHLQVAVANRSLAFSNQPMIE
jgi:hypothetical protein